MIRAIALNKKKEIKDIDINHINDPDIQWYWIDFDQPTENEIKQLYDVFHFHPLAIEDCIHTLQRPKYDHYESYTFFVLHSLSNQGLVKKEIDFFVSEHYIVSYHKDQSKEIDEVWKYVMDKQSEAPFDIFYKLIDKLVDNYFPILYRIEDELNEIDDYTNRNMQYLMRRLFEIRGELLQLRHTIYPMRDLLYRMLNSQHLEGVLKRKAYFSDIYDHLIKLAEMIESNREITADVRDSYLSLNSHLTNRNMMVLTVITVIFMPITFIVGLYGMNFEYMPELQLHYGYYIVIGIMTLIVITMFLWFKKKGWFDQ